MGRRKKGLDIHGWINLDKPYELGSTQAVSRVRRLFDAKKAGHAGTLDPLASGILPIALGDATKTVPYIQDRFKVYEFVISFGEQRNTDDLEGEVIQTSDLRPSEESLLEILPNYIGDIEQIPPQFSAIKIDGQRAYDLARDGQQVDIKSRVVVVEELELLSFTPDNARMRMLCGKGTYVRSLARDIGIDLGCYGYISELRRMSVGSFTEDNSISLEKLEELAHSSRLDEVLLPIETALDDILELAVSEAEVLRLKNGQNLSFVSRYDAERLSSIGIDYRDEDIDLVVAMHKMQPVAICEVDRVTIQPIRVFNL